MSLFDEPADFSQIPDEVVLQLHVPAELAYALLRVSKAYKRLGENADRARQAMVDMLNEMANT